MGKRNKKTIKTLVALSKLRTMEMELAQSDTMRAEKLFRDVEARLQQVQSDIKGIEAGMRDTVNNQSGFSVQQLTMQRSYLSERRDQLSNVRNRYDMAVKTRDETIDMLKNKKQQLELVERKKDNKIKRDQFEHQKQIFAVNDELCVQKRRTEK